MSQSKDPARLVRLVETDTKGRSVVAQTVIPAGTLIFSEEPLLTMNFVFSSEESLVDPKPASTPYAGIIDDFAALPQEKKDLVLDLEAHDTASFREEVYRCLALPNGGGWWHVNRKYGAQTKDVLTAFNTNAVGRYLGIKTAMLNHSCLPNAYVSFDEGEEGEEEIVVHALRDIKDGEEVCVSHLKGAELFQPKALRREILLLQRGFECLCDACASTNEDDEKMRAKWRFLVDKYRRLDGELRRSFGKRGHRGLDHKFVDILREVSIRVIDIMEEMRLASVDTAEWYEKVIYWSEHLKDKKGKMKNTDTEENANDAKEKWIARLLDVVRVCVGDESTTYLKMWQKMDSAGHQEERTDSPKSDSQVEENPDED